MTRRFFLVAPLFFLACSAAPPVEWHDAAGYRWREVQPSQSGLFGGLGDGEGFTQLGASRTGIDFANALDPHLSLSREHLLVGSGVTLGDVDGDDLIDIYLTRLEGSNVLYRNLGDFRFEDITERAGVGAVDRFSSGAVMADVDGDGDLDLLVTALGGPNALYRNDGTGRFADVTSEVGLDSDLAGMTMTLADVDGDGDLDLYVANYKVVSAADVLLPYERTGEIMVESGDSFAITPAYRNHFRVETLYGRETAVEQANPDRFYLNDGRGFFEPVPWTSGRFLEHDGQPLARALDDFAMGARFYDVDGDGDPDLYVCYDYDDPDRLWINDGEGTFRSAGPWVLRNMSHASMSVDFADIDRDGQVDFFVADMLSLDRERRLRQQLPALVIPKRIGLIQDVPQYPRNTLFRNRGDGTFAQIAEYAGLQASEWSWGSLFLDVDLDGYEDLLVANGHGRDWQDGDAMTRTDVLQGNIRWLDAKALYPELRTRNVAFRNRGDFTFEEVGQRWGFGPDEDISHGLASGDLDGDGDLDVVVNRLREQVLVLRNDAQRARVAVRLVGRAPNTRGVGAKVRLVGGAVPVQEKEVTVGGLYLSGADQTTVFAAGDGGALRLEVRWRGGDISVIEGVGQNRLYEISEEGSARPREPGPDEAETPWFEDVSEILGHRHVDTEFNDFGPQPLLPNQLSRLGPGVSWADVDGDLDPDLLVPTGRGGSLVVLLNQNGAFTREELQSDPAMLDQTTVLPLSNEEGGTSLLIGLSSFELETGQGLVFGGTRLASRSPSVVRSALGQGGTMGAAIPAVTGHSSATGPLALADIDADGDLDLFVGGRSVPAQFPVPATSRLFRNEGGQFEPDGRNEDALAAVGLVSGAVFSDVDVDGDPDLLLALEWGPPRLFLNSAGSFTDATADWGLDRLGGRWNGVVTGDLDGDGDPDVVVTGWGRNTPYRPSAGRPLVLYHSDVDQNGRWDVVLAQADRPGGERFNLSRYDRIGVAIPMVRSRIESWGAFSEASLGLIVGEDPEGLPHVVAETLDHLVLMNEGDHFVSSPLPGEAQFAPAFGVVVADLDGDGFEDVFISQNFYATDEETGRYDAGRGLVLKGDGNGGLSPVSGVRSGVTIYGDQRGAATADFDLDGRVDLAVGQNGGPTKLYRNVSARPGLRVRLVGPPGNPTAVGAVIRVGYGERLGPAREIHGGSGYWSLNDPVQVMGLEEAPTQVHVRWPGGRETVSPVATGLREITVRFDGDER